MTRDACSDFLLPSIQQIMERLPPHIPVIYFLLKGAHVTDLLPDTGATALSIGRRQSLAGIREMLIHPIPLQGNLDPALLFASQEALQTEATSIALSMRGYPHIFNLGHGILPGTPVESVGHLVQVLRRIA